MICLVLDFFFGRGDYWNYIQMFFGFGEESCERLRKNERRGALEEIRAGLEVVEKQSKETSFGNAT